MRSWWSPGRPPATSTGPRWPGPSPQSLPAFPFEVALYQEAGVPVEFVGHPILDVLPALDRAAARADLAADGERLIGLLPGSRVEEVERHLPILMAACARIARQAAGARFVL